MAASAVELSVHPHPHPITTESVETGEEAKENLSQSHSEAEEKETNQMDSQKHENHWVWEYAKWSGWHVINGMGFLGEVFADFFGITDSKYQYVVDAYERHLDEKTKAEQHQEFLRRRHREQVARRDARRRAQGLQESSALESGALPQEQFGDHPLEKKDHGMNVPGLHYPDVLAESTAAPSDTEGTDFSQHGPDLDPEEYFVN